MKLKDVSRRMGNPSCRWIGGKLELAQVKLAVPELQPRDEKATAKKEINEIK